MRSTFSGYYAPSDEEYERLWKEALIVVDTNTLLDLYRFPETARDELLKAFELVKDRLWIPHQVGLEFQRQRSNVIAGERASSENALSAIDGMIQDAREKVSSLQIEKRGLGLEIEPLFSELDKIGASIKAAVTKVRDAQPNITHKEPVRDLLDSLFEGRVGPAPANQEDLDALIENGDDRFARRIPPGYEDADKEKNPSAATINFDGIIYPRKFGDLILWRQLIAHVRQNDIKSVMLITSETKEDWWWKEKGRTLGPRPELVREMMREGSVELFWMYGPDQFLKQSERYTKAQVTKKAVDEIAQALSVQPRSELWQESSDKLAGAIFGIGGARYRGEKAIDAVANWLQTSGHEVTISKRDFPDIVAQSDSGPLGFAVKYQRSFQDMLFSPIVTNTILRGYHAVGERKLAKFSLVIVVDQENFWEIKHEAKIIELESRLRRLIDRYSIDCIIVGSLIDDKFELLTEEHRSESEFDNLFR